MVCTIQHYIYKVFARVATIAVAGSALLLTSCGASNETKSSKKEIWVSIAPLQYLVEKIVGNDFEVKIITPPGASPENYELTPKQLIAINEAELVFTTGLIEFENAITSRIESDANIIKLCEGIVLIAGSCCHDHTTPEHKHNSGSDSQQDSHHKAHQHGIDPHIWTSPSELQIMADNIFIAIDAIYPNSEEYKKGYKALKEEIATTDKYCRELIAASTTRSFVVYHPALTYYARSYGLEQIAIEEQGKEPSARHLSRIIEQVKTNGAKCVIYQSQFPRSVVEVAAKDMGIEAVAFDALGRDILKSICAVTRHITGKNRQGDE